MNPRDPKAFTEHFALDYFRRPGQFRRWKLSLSLLAAMVSAGAVAAFVIVPPWRTAFQSGPVSHCHSQFGVDCTACHDKPFATAKRLLPGEMGSSVSDTRCLICHGHQAGRHNPNQTRDTASNGRSAADCTQCHAEHRGTLLDRVPDATCVACHGDLHANAPLNYASSIHHFGNGHPELGAWREKAGKPLHDPGGDVFRFNHELHMKLPDQFAAVAPDRKAMMDASLNRIRDHGCGACHTADQAGEYIKPVRYRDHCAACHPITVQPAGNWPPEVAAKFASEALPHPSAGENAGNVWAALLDRFLRIADQALPTPEGGDVQPSPLRRPDDPKTAQEKLARARTKTTAAQLFDRAGSGCLLCHVETTDPRSRPNDIPVFANPRQLENRWLADLPSFPAMKLRHSSYSDARNRWFPLARFRHDSHLTMNCSDCHRALESKISGDVLMPKLDVCVRCHHPASTSARSDCLACHRYHDRSQETPGRLANAEP